MLGKLKSAPQCQWLVVPVPFAAPVGNGTCILGNNHLTFGYVVDSTSELFPSLVVC
jgi:hypothetical protein